MSSVKLRFEADAADWKKAQAGEIRIEDVQMNKIVEFQPGITSKDVSALLRQLADRADRGEIIGVAIATLGPHNRYGDAIAVADQNHLALLGAVGVMYHSFLSSSCEDVDKAIGETP